MEESICETIIHVGATFLVHAMVKVWEIRPAILANATLLAHCSMVFGQTCNYELYPAFPFVVDLSDGKNFTTMEW